jgi:hypothetical protein
VREVRLLVLGDRAGGLLIGQQILELPLHAARGGDVRADDDQRTVGVGRVKLEAPDPCAVALDDLRRRRAALRAAGPRTAPSRTSLASPAMRLFS